jgi:subtilase family protein
MCDTVAGELLVSFRGDDTAGADLINQIRTEEISHITVLEDLRERIRSTELPMRDIDLRFYRLAVTPGEEAYKIGYLQFFYKLALFKALSEHRLDGQSPVLWQSNYHLQVVPNALLSVRQAPGAGFLPSSIHDDYKNLLGWTPTRPAATKRVLVLDTGLDPANPGNVVSQYNFVDHNKRNDVTDDHGHGTAVTEVIRDLCPSAEFIVYKVADEKGRASEWDTLAALATSNDADIANISLAFGLAGGVCATCGRESHSSRSAVFENMMLQLNQDPNGPLIVAAAGNESLKELSFPARFENVVAVESINRDRRLSQFTNRAAIDHQGDGHPNVFVLPGGEKLKDAAPSEYIGKSLAGKEFYGTSFAAAYATGLIASLWSQATHNSKDRALLLEHLRMNADTSVPDFDPATHGNGMMQFK